MLDAPEELEALQTRISTLTQRLQLLDEQIAIYGIAAPVHIKIDKQQAERELLQARAELRRLQPGSISERAPYLGLLTFQEDDADRFFGRDALIGELVEHVRRAPFLAVLGPSGSGKSSVVRAGLVPRLKSGALPGSEKWRYITLKPGTRPLDTLAAELTRLQGGDLGNAVALSRQLAETKRALLLAADLLLDRAAGQRLVLVVDQAEELWTLAPSEPETRDVFLKEQQQPFIRHLLAATTASDTPLLIILAMRADFLDRAIDQNRDLARAIADHDLFISAMTQDELREAIERPAEDVGAAFEPGLVDELIERTAGQEGGLPLLEYTLLELWKADFAGGMLTWASYRVLGGVEGALAKTADSILSERYTAEQRADLRAILLRLVQPGEGTADTRRRAALVDLALAGGSAEDVQVLLAPLVDARLLVITLDNDAGRTNLKEESTIDPSISILRPSSAQVEVAHEALIRGWPALRGWIDTARDDLRAQIQFEEAARDWETSGNSDDFLWSGLRLANAEVWITRAQPRLNTRDRAFLEASRAEEQMRSAAKVAAARRLRRLVAVMAGALVVAVVAAGAAGWFGVLSQRNAQDAEDRGATAVAEKLRADAQRATAVAAADLALGRQLVAQAKTDTDTYHDRALLLSVEAYQLTNEAAARGNLLHELLVANRSMGALTGHTSRVVSVAFSPNGTTLASGSDDGSIRLWDVRTRQPLGEPLQGHTSNVSSVAFSPDGQTLASGSYDSIRLWDVRTRQPLGEPLTGNTSDVYVVVFSPNGQTLASGSGDGSIRLWDVRTRLPLGEPLRGDSGGVVSVAFSPDGQTLASNGQDGIHLWDMHTRQPLGQPLRGHTSSVESVAFSPDSQTLASGGNDGSIGLWDMHTRQPLGQPLRGHISSVRSVAFSPDGQTLASGSGDGSIRLWDVRTRQPLGEPLIGHAGEVRSVAFSPDGQTLASGRNDSSIGLWDVRTRQPLGEPLRGHIGSVRSVAFSPDGQTLASGSDDGSIRLWDVRTRQPLGEPLRGHTGSVRSVAFSPDGQTLASGSQDGSIRLWDVRTRQPLGEPLTGHAGDVRSVAFSLDGQTLASGGNDSSIRLWDAHTRQPLGEPLRGHTSSVGSVAFSPDGQTLASGSDDGSIRLWDVHTRQPLGEPLIGYVGQVRSVAFSPDGQTLASGRNDSSIGLWDVRTRQPLGEPLTGHIGGVSSVAFSPDGQILASGSDDATAHLWDTDVKSWLSRACVIAGRNFTKHEWDEFIGVDRPYHRTCPQFPSGTGAPADAPALLVLPIIILSPPPPTTPVVSNPAPASPYPAPASPYPAPDSSNTPVH